MAIFEGFGVCFVLDGRVWDFCCCVISSKVRLESVDSTWSSVTAVTDLTIMDVVVRLLRLSC